MYTTPGLAIVGIGAFSQQNASMCEAPCRQARMLSAHRRPHRIWDVNGRQTRVTHAAAAAHILPAPPPETPPAKHHGCCAGAYDSWPYQRPVIFTSLGALEPRSVSDGWMDSNTPAISLLSLSTCQQPRHTLRSRMPCLHDTLHAEAKSSRPQRGNTGVTMVQR